MNTLYNVTLVDGDLREVINFAIPANPRYLATAGGAMLATDKLPEGNIKATMLADARATDEDFDLSDDDEVRIFQRLGSAVHVTLADEATMACSLFVEMVA